LKNYSNIFAWKKRRIIKNRTIIGGLDKILGNWIFEARKDHLPETLISAIKTGLENYSSISPEARQVLLDELTQEIENAIGTITPLPTKPPAQPSEQHQISVEPQTSAPPPAHPSPKPLTASEVLPTTPRSTPEPQREVIGLNAPVTTLHGIASGRAEIYKKLGIKSLNVFALFISAPVR